MNRLSSTYPTLWHRLVAWTLLLMLPLYVLGSDSPSFKPKPQPVDGAIKAQYIDIYTFEENTALAAAANTNSSAFTRALLYPLTLPGNCVSTEKATYVELFDAGINSHPLCRGMKTSLQRFFCVLLI